MRRFSESFEDEFDHLCEFIMFYFIPFSISCDELREESWSSLFSALRSETSKLRELHLTVKTLDLSGNNLEDSEVKILCAGLENPHCKVETLK